MPNSAVQNAPPKSDEAADAAVRRNAVYHVPDAASYAPPPAVALHVFADERRRAVAPDCPTGLIPLDASAALALQYPATTPLMLARYVVVRAGESLSHHFLATGEVYCVMRGAGATSINEGGAGETRAHDTSIRWKAGDVFCLPGASRTRHTASADSLLFVVTDEPQLAYLGLPAPDPGRNTVVAPALFGVEEIDSRLGSVHARTGPQMTKGKAVVFTTPPLSALRCVLPSLTAAINTLEPGGDQRPHRHNAAAITLALECEGVYSMAGDQRVEWIPFAAMVTPPMLPHSHHNRGPRAMRSLVVQDGALYYAARNDGFAYTD